MTSKRRGAAATVGATAALLGSLLSPAAFAPAQAEGNQSGTLVHGDQEFNAYAKKGETVTFNATLRWRPKAADRSWGYTVQFIGPGGVTRSCVIKSWAAIGTKCSFTALASTAGGWRAILFTDHLDMDTSIDTGEKQGLMDSVSWNMSVTNAAGTRIPGRVWAPYYYTMHQDYGDHSGADLRAGARDVRLYYLSDMGWLYRADYKGYNGIHSRMRASEFGVTHKIDDTAGYHSYSISDKNVTDHDPQNPLYRVFFENPANDLPVTAQFGKADGTTFVKGVSRENAIAQPAITSFTFTPSSTTSHAGTYRWASANYRGDQEIWIDTNGNGARDVADYHKTLGRAVRSFVWDGTVNNAGGAKVPVSKNVLAWVRFPYAAEAHFVNTDVELRTGLQVYLMNGNVPAGTRDVLYWDDTNLDASRTSTTNQKDGSTGVHSITNHPSGVHSLPLGPDGKPYYEHQEHGWGDDRYINDWTFVPIQTTRPFTVAALRPDVRITKDLTSAAVAERGSVATWKVRVSNLGSTTATGVKVTDVFPAGMTNPVMVNPTKGTVSGNTWTVGTLAVNEVREVTVQATIPANTTATSFTNLASVTSIEDPRTATTYQDSATFAGDTDQGDQAPVTVAAAKPNVKIVKARTATTPVAPGDTVTWDVTVLNDGPVPATNVVVDDIFPTGWTNTVVDGVAGTSKNLGTLAAGQQVTFPVSATAPLTATAGKYTNKVTVTSTEDPYGTGCVDNGTVATDTDNCDLHTVSLAEPDVKILKERIGTGLVDNGDTVTWKVSVTNDGAVAADNTVVNEVAPAGYSDVTLTSPSLGTVSGNAWTVGTLPVGAVETVTVTAKVADKEADLLNKVTVSADGDTYVGPGCEDNTELAADADNCDVNGTQPLPDDVKIDKARVGTGTVKVGDTITWTITVKNAGKGTASSVVMDDVFPAGTGSQTLTTPSTGTVTGAKWTIGDMAPGAVETITATAVITDDTVGSFKNTATVTSPEDPRNPTDPCAENAGVDLDEDNCDTSIVTIAPANVKILKVLDTTTPVKPGQVVNWTITVTNEGDRTATNVIVDDHTSENIPAGAFLSAPSKGEVVDDWHWMVGTLAPGETQTVKVSGTLAKDAAGDVTNVATVDSTEDPLTWTDPYTGPCEDNTTLTADADNCDLVVTDIVEPVKPGTPAKPSLQIDKRTGKVTLAKDGATATVVFHIDVRNAGLGNASNVVVTENLPKGAKDVKVLNASKGAYKDGKWTVGSMTAGEKQTIALSMVVPTGEKAVNGATVTSPDDPYTPTENCQINTTLGGDLDQCDQAQIGFADVRIIKKAASVKDGVVTWSIEVGNFGDGVAHNTVVSDSLSGKEKVEAVTVPKGTTFKDGKWTVGTLKPGQKMTLTVKSKHTKAALEAGVRNVAAVNATEDPYENGTKPNDTLKGDDDNFDDALVKQDKPGMIPNAGGPALGLGLGGLALLGLGGVALRRSRKQAA